MSGETARCPVGMAQAGGLQAARPGQTGNPVFPQTPGACFCSSPRHPPLFGQSAEVRHFRSAWIWGDHLTSGYSRPSPRRRPLRTVAPLPGSCLTSGSGTASQLPGHRLTSGSHGRLTSAQSPHFRLLRRGPDAPARRSETSGGESGRKLAGPSRPRRCLCPRG